MHARIAKREGPDQADKQLWKQINKLVSKMAAIVAILLFKQI